MILGKVGMQENAIIERGSNSSVPVEIYTNTQTLCDERLIKQFLDLVKTDKVRPKYIHTPESEIQNELCKSADGVDFISPYTILYNSKDLHKLERTMQVAQLVSAESKQDNKISVVMHNDRDNHVFRDVEFSKSSLLIKQLLDKYPRVDIMLENITKLDGESYGYTDEAKRYIDFFYEDYPEMRNRLGITFDTCHAIITARRYLNNKDATFISFEPEFTELFECNLQYLREIHLANAIGYGDGKVRHAREFDVTDPESVGTLKMILHVINESGWDGDITLEVVEDTYPSSKNFIKTYECLTALMDSMDTENIDNDINSSKTSVISAISF